MLGKEEKNAGFCNTAGALDRRGDQKQPWVIQEKEKAAIVFSPEFYGMYIVCQYDIHTYAGVLPGRL